MAKETNGLGAMITLDWRNLTYTLPSRQKGEAGKTILHEAFGRCEPGEILAILGPSGGGKTSLLNALAGRTPSAAGAKLTGTILLELEGKAYHRACVDLPSVSAYVEQDDALFALSTVEETLQMNASLRMPELTANQREHRTSEVISMLGLSPARKTMVGSDQPGQRGISGGERKRVHIGLELLHKPRLIFVDEPTSGLDSFQALSVMSTLKELVGAGHTVVCSIHQPRSSICQLIDKVLLVAEGRMAYFGPGGESCAEHFSRIGHPVPARFNAADHYLDLISIDHRNPEDEERSRKSLEAIVAACPAAPPVLLQPQPMGSVAPPVLRGKLRARAPFHVAFGLLLQRTWRELTRDVGTLATKYAANTFFTLVFGWVYFQMDMSQTALMNRQGLCFFMAMNQAFGSVIGVSQVIPRQLKVVSRERAAKLYEVLPFYLATFLCQLPLELLPQLIFGTVLYLLTGLRPGIEHLLTYIGVLMLENFAGIGMGMMLSASFDNVEQAPQLAPLAVVFLLMFSGFLLNQDSIPRILTPVKYVSFIRYAFQALAVNELKGNDGFASDRRLLGGRGLQGDDMLRVLHFEDVSIPRNCRSLLLLIFIFNLLAFRILNQKRPSFLKLRWVDGAASAA